jgi:pyruvate/2-oxoglutarate dehydrogenase complex dihydrolipoamide acyltransferase (E2) component
MAAVVIRDAHLQTVSQIADEIRTKAAKSRRGDEGKTMSNKYFLSKIPWPFRTWIFKLVKFFVNDLGFNLRSLGLSDNSFGSIMLSNIGTHGLTTGLPALFPAAKLPAVVIMGKSEIKAAVVDDEIIPRQILPLSGTFDHRIMDGGQIGKLARGIARRLGNPTGLDAPEIQ